jgi:Spy/CpxP family protein refolding chaperone
MSKKTIQMLAAAALTAGLGLAQTAPQGPPANPPAPQQQATRHPMANPRRGAQFARERLMRALNLTDAQKQQAKEIFAKSRQAAVPLRQELLVNRKAMTQAVQANANADIRKLSVERGRLIGRLTETRSQARAEFFTILTPAQKAKVEQFSARTHQHPRLRSNG